MACSHSELQEKYRLYKFTKVLTLKVAQIVVQSRQGKKITQECNPKYPDNSAEITPPLQWFNLSIPDEPAVNDETRQVLNGEVVDALSKVLCIEISLHTNDGDEMTLELWTVKLVPGTEVCSPTTVYYRMSVMLKSTLSISRITPAYKLARAQYKESFKIFHKIYGGEPNYELLGEKRKTIKVSELHTPIGTLIIEVVYRTKMTILPQPRHKMNMQHANNDIMVKSDHFNLDNPKKHDKKEIDLSKPLTAGAFVDVAKMKELHNTLSQKLPPEPPMAWMLAEKDKMEKHMRALALAEQAKKEVGAVGGEASGSSAHAVSKAIEVPKAKNGDKYTTLMARSMSDEWTDVVAEKSASTDSETLSRQLKMYEEAVPEFDNMVASMFSNSETGSDHS